MSTLLARRDLVGRRVPSPPLGRLLLDRLVRTRALHDPGEEARNRAALLLLVLPFVGMLWVPFVAFPSELSVGGIPFFYWYQAVWILVGAALTTLVYFVTREEA